MLSATRNGTASKRLHNHDIFIVSFRTVPGSDYVATSVSLDFFRGDSRKCHSVKIINDGLCEPMPEDFFADMDLVSASNINTTPSLAQILVNGTNEDDMEHPTAHSSTDNCTAAIIGGVVAAVIVLVIAIAVVTAAIIAWKHHHRNPSIQDARKSVKLRVYSAL